MISPRKEWKCFEILHAGERRRGRDVIVTTSYYIPAEAAAEEAAEYFEVIDQREEDYGVGDSDGTHRYIEVEGGGVYECVCEVVRNWHASEHRQPALQANR